MLYLHLFFWDAVVMFLSPQVSCSPVRLSEGAVLATCFVIKIKLQSAGNN